LNFSEKNLTTLKNKIMNTKRLKEYLKEIDRLKKLDWNTSIKVNQEFKDRKEQKERNKKTNFDKRLINYITNLK